jgi:hypothetical protein
VKRRRWCSGAGFGLFDPDYCRTPTHSISKRSVRSLILFLTTAQGLCNSTRFFWGVGGMEKLLINVSES